MLRQATELPNICRKAHLNECARCVAPTPFACSYFGTPYLAHLFQWAFLQILGNSVALRNKTTSYYSLTTHHALK